SQWHLSGSTNINVTPVWADYTGAGVTVGVVDTGIDYNHTDLAPNYRHDIDYDARDDDFDSYASAADDNHGTPVSGVIAADDNGNGTI
ncbi:MAG: S8 family serine peptidase, partial [Rhodospirillales bacterium]